MPVTGLSLLGPKRIRGFVSILRYINPTIIIIIIRVAGKVGWESPCPLGKVLTCILNFPFYCINTWWTDTE